MARHQFPSTAPMVTNPCGSELVDVERGLCAKVSWKHHHVVGERMNRLRGVQGTEAGEEAFEELLAIRQGQEPGSDPHG